MYAIEFMMGWWNVNIEHGTFLSLKYYYYRRNGITWIRDFRFETTAYNQINNMYSKCLMNILLLYTQWHEANIINSPGIASQANVNFQAAELMKIYASVVKNTYTSLVYCNIRIIIWIQNEIHGTVDNLYVVDTRYHIETIENFLSDAHSIAKNGKNEQQKQPTTSLLIAMHQCMQWGKQAESRYTIESISPIEWELV